MPSLNRAVDMVQAAIGYIIFLLVAFFTAEKSSLNAKKYFKPIILGILFQIIVVLAITKSASVISALEYVASGVMKLQEATLEGTKFVFGYLGGAPLPFEQKDNSSTFILALQSFPTVILVAALAAILTYTKILPLLAKVFGSIFKWIFGVNDAVGMVTVSKIFVGQLEGPLLVKPALGIFTKSNTFIIMALAFSTSSAAVTPVYSTIISSIIPNAMTYIIIASVVSVISTLIVCSIMIPNDSSMDLEITNLINNKGNKSYPNLISAMSKGLSDGVFVWVAIVGSLIGMIALITIINYILGLFPDISGTPITLQKIFGMIMYPIAVLIGIPLEDASQVAQVLGSKMVMNEVVAFFELSKTTISQSSVITSIYAITNFGNFSCIGITVGGLLALSPENKYITNLGTKAFLAGFLATCLTASALNMMSFAN